MEPSLNTWAILLLIAAAQGVFLSLVLMIHSRGNRRANFILAILIYLFSMRLLETAGYWTKYLLAFPHFWLTTAALPFLFGVLLYFYAWLLTSENFRLDKKAWLHFLPFVLHLGSLIPYYRLSGAIKHRILEKMLAVQNSKVPWLYFLIFLLQISHMLIYTGLTLRLVKRHSQAVKGPDGSIEKISLQWLRNLSFGFGAFATLTLLYAFCLRLGFPYSRAIDALVLIALASQIYIIGYKTLRQPEIFSGGLSLKNAPKYEKSALSPAQAQSHLSKLIQVIETEKLFTNCDLKLHELARRLNISPHHLSQIINDKLGQNFFEFLNQYRVAEAQRWLADPQKQHFTILSISQEVGFNSKASFNTAFKKHTGMTPSQFRDSNVKANKV